MCDYSLCELQTAGAALMNTTKPHDSGSQKGDADPLSNVAGFLVIARGLAQSSPQIYGEIRGLPYHGVYANIARASDITLGLPIAPGVWLQNPCRAS